MPPPQIPSISAPNPSNQYDFIVGYNPRSGNNWLLQSPLKTRIAVFAGGLFVLFLIIWIFIALISSSGNTNTQNLTALAQQQTELARVSNEVMQNTNTQTTLNLAITVRLSLLTDQLTFMSYLGSVNATPSTDVLSQDMNAQTDSELSAAQANGTYDQTYASITNQELDSYAAGLKRAFGATNNPSQQQLLRAAYQHAQLLLAMNQNGS